MLSIDKYRTLHPKMLTLKMREGFKSIAISYDENVEKEQNKLKKNRRKQ